MTRMSLRARIEEDGIRATVAFVSNGADDTGWEHTAWKVTLRHTNAAGKRRQMTVPYRTGVALGESDVTAESVLSCVLSDANGYENAGSFSAWCEEYGYSDDSIKYRATYDAINKQTDQLYKFLGRRTRVFLDPDQTNWQI